MKLFDNKENEKINIITVEKDDLKDAKLSSQDFLDGETKKRAFINVLGARLAMKMLFSHKIEANNLYSLYTIHNVIEELDIADIYFQGIKMDIRLVFDREEIFIPKTHFEYDLLPDLYLVFELSKDFSSVEFLGFFEPKIVNPQNQNKDFYFHECERLINPAKLKTFLNDFIIERNFDISEDNFSKAQELFLSLADKEISKKDKRFLLKQLSSDIVLREKMVEFENFEMLSKAVVENETIIKDAILDIVGAQKLFEDEDPRASKAEIKADVHGEVLSDLLEEDLKKGTETEIDKDFLKELADETDNNSQGSSILSDGLVAGGAIVTGAAGAAALGTAAPETALVDLDAMTAGVELAESDLTDLEQDIIKDDTKTETIEDQDFSSLLTEETSNDVEDLEAFVVKENVDSEFNFNQEKDKVLEFTDLTDDFKDDFKDDLLLKMPELENFNEVESSIDGQKKEETDEEVISLDDFAYNALNENNSDETEKEQREEDEVVSMDKMLHREQLEKQSDLAKTFEQTPEDVLQKLRKMESEEDIVIPEDDFEEQFEKTTEEPEKNENDLDDYVNQVDKLLNDAHLSDEQKSILEDILADSLGIDYGKQTKSLIEEKTKEAQYVADNQTNIGKEFQTFSNDETDDQLLKVLFQEGKSDVMSELPVEEPKNKTSMFSANKLNFAKDKKTLIAASVAGLVLASVVIGGIFHNNKNNGAQLPQNISTAPISANGQSPADTAQYDLVNQGENQSINSYEQESVSDGRVSQAKQSNDDMGKAVSNAFLSEPVNASISKVAWEVPEDLAYNDGFRKYLQTAGRNLKLNLQNSLLLATEMAYSNKVIIDLNISSTGALQSENIVVSSGSKQIDKIVLQSVKETLNYLRIPSDELGGSSATATLIINF